MAGFTARNPTLSISTETRLKLYRTMLECRVLEKRAYDLFMQNLIKGTSHLALGQEAIAAGFGTAMRPDEEVKAWLAKDPLPRYRSRLLELGIDAADIEKIEAETNAEIDRATETARNAPPPPLEIADTDVWADGGSAWRN